MDMNFLRLAYYLFFSFNLKNEMKTNKDILSKAKDKDERSILVRVTPYIILLMVFILLILGVWIMVTHGAGLTGTEANTWQRMEGII